MSPYTVLVSGCRYWDNITATRAVVGQLEPLLLAHEELRIIDGKATGIDTIAHVWANMMGLEGDRHRCFPVDWKKYQRGTEAWKLAGPTRNAKMAAKRPDEVLAFHQNFDLHKGGTSGMVLMALQCGIPVKLFVDDSGSPVPTPGLKDFSDWRRSSTERLLTKAGAFVKHNIK